MLIHDEVICVQADVTPEKTRRARHPYSLWEFLLYEQLHGGGMMPYLKTYQGSAHWEPN